LKRNNELNIGIIGMGKMGLLHASIVNTIPNTRLSAIYDKSPVLKRFAGKALNDIQVTDNFDEFAGVNYDAVYVTTPIPTHFSIVEDIYARRMTRNIFVEKTLTASYEQSAMLCLKAKSAGGVTMVGYMSRFAPTFRKAHELLLKDGAIGNPVGFQAYAYASDFVGVKGKSLPGKGSPTSDLGAHIIDMSLWFFGELQVEPSTTAQLENGSHFTVRTPQGLTGEFDISWAKPGYRLPEFGLAITGTKGVITVNADAVKLEKIGGVVTIWHRQDFQDNVPFLLGAPEYYREDAHFISAILEGSSAEPDFVTAAKVDLLIDRVEGRTGTKQ